MNGTERTTTVDKLQAIIRAQEADLRQKTEQIRALSFDPLRKEEEIALLRHKIFGRMSEKLTGEDCTQGKLFNEAEATADALGVEDRSEAGETVAVAGHTRKKTGRRPLPADFPREDRVHDIGEEEKVCGCGAALVRIGEETSEELEIIPASVKVIRHIRPKYSCPACEGERREPGTSTVAIAPLQPRLIPRSIASASLVAFIAVGKFCDGLPFSRQEKQFARIGVEISRADMSNWIIAAGRAVAPIIELLQLDLRAGPVARGDETPVQVHNEPGRANTAESRMWVFLGGVPGKPVVLYQYHITRSGEVPLLYLSGFEGFFQSDDYSGYNALAALPDIIHVGCFAHARRRFVDAQKGGGKSGSAETALAYIARIYKVEKELRTRLEEKELSLDAFTRTRRRAVVPILREFRDWYRKRMSEVPPETLIGKAFSYLHHE